MVMRCNVQIKQIKVQNFGKLENVTLDFKEGINQIVENNGYGKTTIMAFIKAMFYGFSSSLRSKDINANERLRYMPWNKKVFGGNLTFEHEGKEYKIERVFGNRASQDEVKVYELATLKMLDVENVGMYFFGIDEQSFERCIFIGNDIFSSSASAMLIGKLHGNANSDDAMLSNYENAIKKLENKRSIYIKSGNKGLVNEKQREVLDLQLKKEECERNIQFLEMYNNQIAQNKELLEQVKQNKLAVEKDIMLANKQEQYAINRKHMNNLLQSKREKQIALDNLLNNFNGNIPSEECLQQCNEKVAMYQALKVNKINLQSKIDAIKQCVKVDSFDKDINDIENTFKTSSCQNSKKEKSFIFGIFGVSFIILSVFLFIFTSQLFVGIGLLTLGLISCGVYVFKLFYNKKIKGDKNCNIQLIGENSHFKDFVFSEDKDIALEQIKNLKEERLSYQMLKLEKNALIEQIKQLQIEIDDMFYFVTINGDDYLNALEQTKTILIKIENLKTTLEEIDAQYKNFERVENVDFDKQLNLSNLKMQQARLASEEETLLKELLELTHKKTQVEEKIDELFEIDVMLDEAKNNLNQAQEECDIILNTISLLKEAKLSLGSRYTMPLQQKVNEYVLKWAELKKFAPIRLKDDLTLTYEQDGEIRDEKTLSLGLRTVFCMLCRFALAEIIFQKNCIIYIDDSFAYLDEQNFQMIKEILLNLSSRFQIFYVTCTNDRMLV